MAHELFGTNLHQMRLYSALQVLLLLDLGKMPIGKLAKQILYILKGIWLVIENTTENIQ
jgi:hypothetical protein